MESFFKFFEGFSYITFIGYFSEDNVDENVLCKSYYVFRKRDLFVIFTVEVDNDLTSLNDIKYDYNFLNYDELMQFIDGKDNYVLANVKLRVLKNDEKSVDTDFLTIDEHGITFKSDLKQHVKYVEKEKFNIEL